MIGGFEAKNKERYSYHHISKEIIDWAWNTYFHPFAGMYPDNFRMARIWKSSDMRRYQREKKTGCCGFFDELVIGPDGNKYMVGLNYGH